MTPLATVEGEEHQGIDRVIEPVGPAQRIRGRRIEGAVRPRLPRSRREGEVKEGIPLRTLEEPATVEGAEVGPPQAGIGRVANEMVEIHERHLVVRLVAGTNAELKLR